MIAAHATSSSLIDLYDSVPKGEVALLKTLAKLFACQKVSIKEQPTETYLETRDSDKEDIQQSPSSFILNGKSALLPFKSNQRIHAYLSIEFASEQQVDECLKSPNMLSLLPHINQALGMSYQLTQQETDLDSIHYVLNHYPIPCIAIDNHFNTVFSNRAAQELLTPLRQSLSIQSLSPGSLSTGSHLRVDTVSSLRAIARENINLLTLCRHEKQKQELKLAISNSFTGNDINSRHMNIELANQNIPLIISASNSLPNIFQHYSRDSLSWVYFLSADYTQTLKSHSNFKSLKLSAAETSLATLLFEGNNLNDIAETRNVSKQTVRKQLQAILRKTACENQETLMIFFFEQCVHYSLMPPSKTHIRNR